jgi:hypothetical protein
MANTVAYWAKIYITTVKSFILHAQTMKNKIKIEKNKMMQDHLKDNDVFNIFSISIFLS